jgi:predicted PurR-regulated permease PerM
MADLNRTVRATVICGALVFAAWLLRDVLLLAFASILLGCLLRAASLWVSRVGRISPSWALLLVIVAGLAVFGALGIWRGSEIAGQSATLVKQLRGQAQNALDAVQSTDWGGQLLAHLQQAGPSVLDGIGGFLTGFASSTLGLGGGLLLIGATGVFLALSPGTYVNGTLRLLPPSWRGRGREIMEQLGRTLQSWFMGQLVDMLVVTLLTGVGLALLGMKLALTLAVFAGLMNFVPFIGALVGAVPALVVAIGQSPGMALWVAGLFIVVQGLEGNVIAPLVQKRTVALPPALTIFAQTLLGTLFGALGLVLATPIMAAVMVLVRMGYVESVLERDGAE